MKPLTILIGSTPVGPLGSGVGGGVELTIHNLVLGLSARGHNVEVMAPSGSLHVGERTHQIEGSLQPSVHLVDRREPVCIPPNSVLANMWSFARARQHHYDVILNLSYDWLPLYIAGSFEVPVAHLVSMASVSTALDEVINDRLANAPETMAMHSHAQANTFALGHRAHIVGSGVALQRYDFVDTVASDAPLGFIGRISPEKGILDLFALSSETGERVKVWGLMQDQLCWDEARRLFPAAEVSYEGFLPTDNLQRAIGGCKAIVMSSKWVEAFGNVALEAMACGVPVVAYNRGGPSEVIIDSETGFLVTPDDVQALSEAVNRVGTLSRAACRDHVATSYSTGAFAERVENWLVGALQPSRVLD